MHVAGVSLVQFAIPNSYHDLVIECNPGQVVNTHVPLSPSSIILLAVWPAAKYVVSWSKRQNIIKNGRS